ncbi:hypothetical protein CVT24_010808 [Panaeolus cyanescens]|uniref:G domain-containing protein n=1 Tax=Panaeolus cyanescens TaxID=181874 RepID=A0A409VGW9_9AGAR|nr:hypothetical protein CVT24_010808 [Panaeolus cyanescens]
MWLLVEQFLETLGGGIRHSTAPNLYDTTEKGANWFAGPGLTRRVSAFIVNNVQYVDWEDDDDNPWDVYFIDSPGLSNGEVSVMDTIEDLRVWMNSHGRSRQTASLVKSMAGIDWAGSVVIVTTKWDMVHTKKAHVRAERCFEQLREDTWEDFHKKGAPIVKFNGTHGSAFEVLDKILSARAGSLFELEQMVDKDRHVRETPFHRHVYEDLISRMEKLQHHHKLLAMDKAKIDVEVDSNVEEAMQEQLEKVTIDIQTLQLQIDEFGEVE